MRSRRARFCARGRRGRPRPRARAPHQQRPRLVAHAHHGPAAARPMGSERCRGSSPQALAWLAPPWTSWPTQRSEARSRARAAASLDRRGGEALSDRRRRSIVCRRRRHSRRARAPPAEELRDAAVAITTPASAPGAQARAARTRPAAAHAAARRRRRGRPPRRARRSPRETRTLGALRASPRTWRLGTPIAASRRGGDGVLSARARPGRRCRPAKVALRTAAWSAAQWSYRVAPPTRKTRATCEAAARAGRRPASVALPAIQPRARRPPDSAGLSARRGKRVAQGG